MPKRSTGEGLIPSYQREAISECLRHAFPLGDAGSFGELPKAIKQEDQKRPPISED